MIYLIGVILLVIGIVGYFMGSKGMAGVSPELGKFLLVVGVILGIILILVGQFAVD